MKKAQRVGPEGPWLYLKEFSNPEDEDRREFLQEQAKKYKVSQIQVARIHYAVWMGTNSKKDPLWKEKILTVAAKIGDKKTISIIAEWVGLKLDTTTSLADTMANLPSLLSDQHKTAMEAVGEALESMGISVTPTR